MVSRSLADGGPIADRRAQGGTSTTDEAFLAHHFLGREAATLCAHRPLERHLPRWGSGAAATVTTPVEGEREAAGSARGG
jgi:hypothetical protein